MRVTIQLEHLGRRFKLVFHGGEFYRLMERVICHPGTPLECFGDIVRLDAKVYRVRTGRSCPSRGLYATVIEKARKKAGYAT